MTNAGLLRTAFTRRGVPGLSCRGATHTVRSARLEVSVARVRDLVEFAELEDDEIRYRQGTSHREVAADLAAFPTDVPIWTRETGTFVARERRTGRLVAILSLYLVSGRQMHVGGSVVAGARRQGYGREALGLVCAVGHRHLGMRQLIARCEAGNEASCRWLTSAGFTRVPGDPSHALPDGRAVEVLWWQHADPLSRRRCPSPQAPGLPLHLP